MHELISVSLEQETVIAGSLTREDSSYHANLQEVLKQEFQQTHFVRRKYGYFLDPDRLLQNDLLKCREYMKLPNGDYSSINPEHLYTLPAGDYAVFTVQIQDETADFSPLLDFLSSEGFTTDIVFAEEIGFQLFKYIHNYPELFTEQYLN